MKLKPQILIFIGAALLVSAGVMFAIGELLIDDATAQLGVRIAAGADLAVGAGFLFVGLRKLGESRS